jgi:oxalate decarboxylase/phosphoglucose isomerase-like protein (cupin superfamily)
VKRDLSSVAGFPLIFDEVSLEVVTDPGFAFAEKHQLAGGMRAVLETPDAVPPDIEVYRTYLPRLFPSDATAALERLEMTYSLVALRPGRIGREFNKTRGHLHAILPGTSLTSPEVYAQLSGRLTLLLQRASTADNRIIEDFVIHELEPGSLVVIPPGYAHALANPYQEPGLLAGLYGNPIRYPPRYEVIRRLGGFAYRVVSAAHGASAFELNPRYESVPPPCALGSPPDGLFAAPNPLDPLWSSFLRTPDAYAFLSEADAARARFGRTRATARR